MDADFFAGAVFFVAASFFAAAGGLAARLVCRTGFFAAAFFLDWTGFERFFVATLHVYHSETRAAPAKRRGIIGRRSPK